MTEGGRASLKAAVCVAILFGGLGLLVFQPIHPPRWILYLGYGVAALKLLIDFLLGRHRRRNGAAPEIN